jgi:uncharacterized protein YjbJ (UPF0337 family)
MAAIRPDRAAGTQAAWWAVFDGSHAIKENTVSNTTKRIEGAAEQVGGAIKKGVGHLIGNEKMEASGRVEELEGVAKQAAAKAAERVKGAAQEAGGAVKHGVGQILGNEQMTAEGKVKELEGQARQKLNN